MSYFSRLHAELAEEGPTCPEDCVPDPRDDEPCICGRCNGSGEGYTDGSTCSACGGSGEERDYEAERDREAERADYLYDQMKDDRLMAQYEDRFDYPDDDLPF